MAGSNNPLIKAIADAEQGFSQIVEEANIRLNFRREASFARRIVESSAQLQRANPASLYRAILDAASVGLTLNPTTQHATIIPRNVKVGGRGRQSQWETRAFLQPMYRGLIALACNGGSILAVEADVVYEADIDGGVWHFARGISPVLEHTPSMAPGREDTQFLGAWTKAIVRDLGPQYPIIDFMPAVDIYKARDASDAYRDRQTKQLLPDAPWVKWFNEQAKKTAIKRAQKLWPHTSERLSLAVDLDNRAHHAGEAVDESDADEVVMITHEEQTELGSLLQAAKLRPEKFFEAFGIDSLEELPAERFIEAKERLERRIEATKESGHAPESGND